MGEKKDFQLFYCLHMIALLFMSARPILGHFLSIFDGFLSKLPLFAHNCDFFCHFEYFSTFLVQNSVRGATFNFRPILVDFHGYTLNMTSYYVTEAINGYF